MAEERGLQVDVEGFINAMDEARERSRSAQNKVLNILRNFIFSHLHMVTHVFGYSAVYDQRRRFKKINHANGADILLLRKVKKFF